MPVRRPGTRTQKKPTKKPTIKKPLLKKVKVKTSVKPSSSRAPDIAKPQGKPKLGRKTIKLTAMQLWKTCDAVRREGVKRLAVRTVKKGVVRKSDVLPPDTPYYRVIVFNKDKGHDHKVTVFMPSGPFTKKANIITDCDCFDSMYTFEWVMAKKYGTSFIWRCNGEPPDERNPGYVPGICKHTRMALTYLLKKAQDGTLKRIDNSKTNGTKMSLMRG